MNKVHTVVLRALHLEYRGMTGTHAGEFALVDETGTPLAVYTTRVDGFIEPLKEAIRQLEALEHTRILGQGPSRPVDAPVEQI